MSTRRGLIALASVLSLSGCLEEASLVNDGGAARDAHARLDASVIDLAPSAVRDMSPPLSERAPTTRHKSTATPKTAKAITQRVPKRVRREREPAQEREPEREREREREREPEREPEPARESEPAPVATPAPAPAAPAPAAPAPTAPAPAAPQEVAPPAPAVHIADIVAETETPIAAKSAPTAPPRVTPIISASIGFTSGVGRHLSYSGNVTNVLKPYGSGVAPAFFAHFDLYPFAGAHEAKARGFGLYGTLDKVLVRRITLSFADASQQSLDTSEWMYDIGIQYGGRIHQTKQSLTLGGKLGYGRTSFAIATPTNGEVSPVPSVAYDYVEIAAFVTVPFHIARFQFDTTAQFGARPVFAAGELTSGGPGASITTMKDGGHTFGIAAALDFRWHFWGPLALDARTTIENYFSTFSPQSKLQTASDLFYTFGLALNVSF